MKHRWHTVPGPRSTSNKGGTATHCVRCGHIREYVNGRATFYDPDMESVSLTATECVPNNQPTTNER